MSKMGCLCGGIIRNHSCPCPTEGCILREEDQQGYYDGVGLDITAFFEAVRDGRRSAWIELYFSLQYPDMIRRYCTGHYPPPRAAILPVGGRMRAMWTALGSASAWR